MNYLKIENTQPPYYMTYVIAADNTKRPVILAKAKEIIKGSNLLLQGIAVIPCYSIEPGQKMIINLNYVSYWTQMNKKETQYWLDKIIENTEKYDRAKTTT